MAFIAVPVATFLTPAIGATAGAVAGAVVAGAVTGAVVGAATAAITGGDILKGALLGAAVGGISGGIFEFATGGVAAKVAGAAGTTGASTASVASPTAETVVTNATGTGVPAPAAGTTAPAAATTTAPAAGMSPETSRIIAGVGQGVGEGLLKVGGQLLEPTLEEESEARINEFAQRKSMNQIGEWEKRITNIQLPDSWRDLINKYSQPLQSKGLLQPEATA